VTLQVLPFSVGAHRRMSASFTLLSFAPGVSTDVAYQEYAVGGGFQSVMATQCSAISSSKC
jgi:hypothetical protein